MSRLSEILKSDDTDRLKLPFSEFLSQAEIEMIAAKSNFVHYKKKEIIFRQGTRTSHIMYLKSGYVKIFKEGRNSRFIILKIEKSGNFLGLMSVFGDEIHQYSAAAIDDCEIGYIDSQAFSQLIKNNGNYASKLIKVLSSYGLYIFEKLLSQTQKQLPGRIADVLLYFSQDIYGSEKFSFPFTRKELAELAGTTKESFIRTLTEFKNDKIINLNGSDVEIVSMNIVKTLSDLG